MDLNRRDSTSSGLSSVSALLALAIRPLPLAPLEVVTGLLLQRVCNRHPKIFDRLGAHSGKRFGIEPTDFPFAFVLQPIPGRPRASVVRKLPTEVDVRIFSSMASLLQLAEGRLDGDALLFSRELTIEGDIEAALALRNAIDDAEINLVEEVGGIFGPFGELAIRLMRNRGGHRDHLIGMREEAR